MAKFSTQIATQVKLRRPRKKPDAKEDVELPFGLGQDFKPPTDQAGHAQPKSGAAAPSAPEESDPEAGHDGEHEDVDMGEESCSD
eukprot:6719035-Pyramimonas_sp.AAC.1